jgi:hypothetical protein
MKKFTTIALFALFASTAAATARPPQTVTVQFDGLCDTMTLTYNSGPVLYASSHIVGCKAGHAPSSNPIPGVGIIVKRQPGNTHAKDVAVSDTQPDGFGNPVAYVTKLQYPFVTGGAWNAYATSDGQTIQLVASGTYTVK